MVRGSSKNKILFIGQIKVSQTVKEIKKLFINLKTSINFQNRTQ